MTRKRILLGHKCKSAKTSFRGREYIAYYSTKLKHQDGPWKFSGLPGTILEVNSVDGNYRIKATSIEKNTNPVIINKDFFQNEFINWENYTLQFKSFIDKIVKRIKNSDNSGGEGYFRLNKPEIIYESVQLDNGLKF